MTTSASRRRTRARSPTACTASSEFVVGTGGVGISGFGAIQPNSQVRGLSLGVLQLTLKPAGYDFRFVPVAGQTFTDAGSGTCH